MIPSNDQRCQCTYSYSILHVLVIIYLIKFLSFSCENSAYLRTALLTQNTNIQCKKACVYVVCVYEVFTKKYSAFIFILNDTHYTE